MADTARLLLMYAVFPLWVLAGLLDWACHRRTRIEHTAGLPENLLHWLLYGQIGVGLLAVAFLEINGAVLLIVAAVFVVHELTVYLELRYAAPQRPVRPFEQMVHSFMEILPLVSLALLAVMAGEQWRELALVRKREPWPAAYLAGGLAASLLLNVLPLAEEGWRCLRAGAGLRRRTPATPAPR
ncbi:hypothetical protein [Ramlibacter tataouinensis]|uniref:Candidate membrane protein n=1 Tax=Ramlibacter tataouinensis (strain ATCC BAA-407 / DSM 14655 / LMG 21543 / TTB310) TaxID=365046 RepID=F5Y3Z3_RAMTT|nr:hypothetical protein [Ramlibacter tataouinensis]AEG91271.1 Candidate membrane protein [Ramlibacter tataouinensis TTB310]